MNQSGRPEVESGKREAAAPSSRSVMDDRCLLILGTQEEESESSWDGWDSRRSVNPGKALLVLLLAFRGNTTCCSCWWAELLLLLFRWRGNYEAI